MDKIKYTYDECYTILQSRPGCSWDELRKQYKSLIQQWHPDRLHGSSIDISEANTKITQLNIAFKELELFYKKEGQLPVTRYSKNQANLRSSTYKESNSPHNSGKSTDAASAHKSNKSYVRSPSFTSKSTWRVGRFLAVLSFILYLCYILFITPNSPQTEAVSQSHLTTAVPHNKMEITSKRDKINVTSTKNNNISPDDKNDKYFTYGSTISDVIIAQGPPDSINDNTWYYGNSKVYFHEGLVISWDRGPGSPLFARIQPDDKKKKNKEKK